MLSNADAVFLRLCDPESGPPLPAAVLTRHTPSSFCQRAIFHGVHSLVLHNLQTPAWQALLEESWTIEVIRQLKPLVRSDKIRSLALRARGRSICQDLRAGGIPVLLMKGADFADHLYPRPELRSFTDVDLLVRPRDFQAAAQVLIKSGCEHQTSGPLKHSAAYGEELFTTSVGGLALRLELHWNLVNSPALQKTVSATLDDLVDETGNLTVAGRLLLAAIHAGTGHQFDRLKFLLDLRQIVRRLEAQADLDWLRSRLERTGSRQVLATTFELLEALFGCPAAARLHRDLGLRPSTRFWRSVLSPALLLRSHRPRLADTMRKNLYRQLLKRSPSITPITMYPFTAEGGDFS